MMLLSELDEEVFEEIDIDQPMKGLCFWVLTEFNPNHRVVKSRMNKKDSEDPFDPDSYATHPEAMDAANEYADAIKKLFRGSSIYKIEPEMMEDEFHLLVVDKTNIPIAKIGVVAEDYRNNTIH
jgi:hypothetical protein